jgi:hypothetical protein
MSPYQVFGYVSARSQLTFDEEPITAAGVSDVDTERITALVARHLTPAVRYSASAERAFSD